MKLRNKLMHISMLFASACTLAGCAAGAAASGYALKAQSADSLTATAEQKIVDRVKREVMAEGMHPCISSP